MIKSVFGQRWVQALGFAAWVVAAVVAQQSAVPALPAKPGIAAGAVKAGSASVTLAHAYALGPIDSGGTVYQIVLTNNPIPADALAKELARGGQSLLKSGKLQGIGMLVDESGFIRNIVPYIGELRGSSMLASAGQLESFAATARGVTGRGSKVTGDTMGQGWSYVASWNAALVKPQ